ncbi:tyrosine-type recombinase/integrase [Pseudomonas sp. JS3066]|uniref:tyrosine-type recombinase/integrase n=1 Tax=Pseudomonas sp. JS3066 TaxID=3090665 RepID=UPI002E7B9ADE|nr:tyrosine-type recombinase/integrase [Pseudomonas sp. JS3066]WVK96248.1 tyrosine-type recombinase/integrase [Pseudomonas sp. JS3066]
MGERIRIRFSWRKVRRCETLPYPQTPKGIAAAAGLRDQVVQLERMGMLTDEKYLELFPTTSYVLHQLVPTFGEFSQLWLNSRELVKNTRNNYRRALNSYWMPKLATVPMPDISSLMLRKIVQDIEWPSTTDRRFAVNTLSGIFKAALADGVVGHNPAAAIPKVKVQKKEIDPYTQAEADRVIDHLYATLQGKLRIYAAYFELAFWTGMRPCEMLALRWESVDLERRRLRVSRVMVDGEIHERVKTKYARDVLLNDRAMNALEEARRLKVEGGSPFVFPPADGRSAFIRSENTPKEHLNSALEAMSIRRRRQYAARHTYATICLMAGMTPAFVARQLGHSVQVLLDTYARWIDSESDFLELDKLSQFKDPPQETPSNGVTI